MLIRTGLCVGGFYEGVSESLRDKCDLIDCIILEQYRSSLGKKNIIFLISIFVFFLSN